MFRASNIQIEVADRDVGTTYGGIGRMLRLAQTRWLAEAIDERLRRLNVHLRIRESDHVLNAVHNALCSGRCLQNLELWCQDEANLNHLGPVRC